MPSGKIGNEMAEIITDYVIQQVKNWHQKHGSKTSNINDWESRIHDAEVAWHQLCILMGRHRYKFGYATLARHYFGFGPLAMKDVVPNEDNEYESSFEDWALTCKYLPKIVDNVIDGFSRGMDDLRIMGTARHY